MSRRIIGVTVGTPISPKAIERKLNPVKSVNGVEPDENGNVDVSGSTGAGGSARVLLWSNPRPRYDFAAQSVPLDLSGYDGIEVLFHEYDDSSDNTIISSGYIPLDFEYCDYGQGTLVREYGVYYRNFRIDPTSISFELAHTTDDGDTGWYMIPYRIYGFKNCVFDGGVWTPDEHINALIDAKLGVIENGSY